jgi:hypothetical protein
MKYQLTPVNGIPKDENDVRLESILEEQKKREKRYGITLNPNCHVLSEHAPIRMVNSARAIKKKTAKLLCLFCGTPTNIYSHTPMFDFQPVCKGCRDLRNKTHWDNIGEALAPRTWTPKLWTDRHNMKKRMNGGL